MVLFKGKPTGDNDRGVTIEVGASDTTSVTILSEGRRIDTPGRSRGQESENGR